jgi:mycothiol system anti-sigma-R factor
MIATRRTLDQRLRRAREEEANASADSSPVLAGTHAETLAGLYDYLDGNPSAANVHGIREHLDECGPCRREHGLEEAVKRLLNRCCGAQSEPSPLRVKVLTRLPGFALVPAG